MFKDIFFIFNNKNTKIIYKSDTLSKLYITILNSLNLVLNLNKLNRK